MAEGMQEGLDLWPREYDLPPRWDGNPVEWAGWKASPEMFICPPPRIKQQCENCGSATNPKLNVGRIWTEPATAPAAIGRARLNAGRFVLAVITAFRCTACGRDTVVDKHGQVWELDPTDYTDVGSWDLEPHSDARPTGKKGRK